METPIVTDSTGRKITLSLMGPADMLDLLEAADSMSSNTGWVRYASVVCSVSDIDGVPVPRPANKVQIKALAKRLGNEGFAAIASYLYGDAPSAETATDEVATAKNS